MLSFRRCSLVATVAVSRFELLLRPTTLCFITDMMAGKLRKPASSSTACRALLVVPLVVALVSLEKLLHGQASSFVGR